MNVAGLCAIKAFCRSIVSARFVDCHALRRGKLAMMGAGPTSKLAWAGCVALLAGGGVVHAQHAVPLFMAVAKPSPSAGSPERQGFVRIVNHDDRAGEVQVVAFDDAGVRRGPIRLALPAGETLHFNSKDLQDGNPAKGMASGVGAPTVGDWRLEITSVLDIEVLAYVRTRDGFLASMHDVAPADAEGIKLATFNPASNRRQVSRLRLVNPTSAPAAVRIRGVDDRGRTSGVVRASVPARAARTFTAQELEGIGERPADLHGSLGNGDGKWRLTVTADQPVQAMSLLDSPTGHLTNLSTAPAQLGATGEAHLVPLFPEAAPASAAASATASAPASAPAQPFRQGFLRIVSRAANRAATGVVEIAAFDESPRNHAPISLRIAAGETVHINSDDLERGNAAKGLSAGVGDGVGDWRLELRSALAIEAFAYIRTRDGFLTSMHDRVAVVGDSHRVAIFNPASNPNQVSKLRIANSGNAAAHIAISGVDDRNVASGDVRLTVPAGGVRTLSAADLEAGVGVAGALGDGTGKWQLAVRSTSAVDVMSLIQNRTGHLTNLSTADERSAVAFFEERLFRQVVQSRCIACHATGGRAAGTRLVFANTGVENSKATNHGVFRDFVANSDRASLVLAKVRGEANHGGGEQLASGSLDYASLRTYLARLVHERAVAPAQPRFLQLIDAIPAAGAEIDPATTHLSLAHLDRASSTFGYAGSCRPSGVAIRRSLTDLSDGSPVDAVDHHLSCDPAAVSRHHVLVDALGADGSYRQSELPFTTGNDQGDLSLVVRDTQPMPRADIDYLFDAYIATALLQQIEDSALLILAAVWLDSLSKRAWSALRDPNARYDVLTRRVAYTSRNPTGERSTTLTGLVATPVVGPSFERRDRVLVLSHATGSTPSDLEFSNPWYVLAVMFASHGYLVIAPDNWGRGELHDANLPETYLLANRTANNSLDMLRAVLASEDYRAFHDEDAAQTDLALIGYSQGGHTAMALWLAIHSGEYGLRVRELHSGAAPHNLYQTFRGALEHLANRCDGNAYCRLVDRKVILPYAVGRIIPAVLAYAPGGLARADLVEGDTLSADFITNMLDNDARYDALKTTLQRSSFTNLVDLPAAVTAADTQIHLYHSPFDRLVPQQNTRDMAALLAPNFNVTFHEDECKSEGYQTLFDLVATAGPLHVVCGMEVLDEVLKRYR